MTTSQAWQKLIKDTVSIILLYFKFWIMSLKKLLTTREKITGPNLLSYTVMQEFLRTSDKCMEKYKVLLSASCSSFSTLKDSQDSYILIKHAHNAMKSNFPILTHATPWNAYHNNLSKWFEPRSISSSYWMIVRVRVVLKRTVVGDWRFDNLSGSHLQSQVNSICQSMML